MNSCHTATFSYYPMFESFRVFHGLALVDSPRYQVAVDVLTD